MENEEQGRFVVANDNKDGDIETRETPLTSKAENPLRAVAAVTDEMPTTEPGRGGDDYPEQRALTMMGSFIADLPSVTNRSIEDFYYFVSNSQGEDVAIALMSRLEDAIGKIPGGTQAFRTVQQVRRGVEAKQKAANETQGGVIQRRAEDWVDLGDLLEE